jgi:hypothetical protein
MAFDGHRWLAVAAGRGLRLVGRLAVLDLSEPVHLFPA